MMNVPGEGDDQMLWRAEWLVVLPKECRDQTDESSQAR
jgi:hypothetical protein